MSEKHDHNDIQKHMRTYIGVFVSLLVFTVLTVGASCLQIQSVGVSVTIALAISCIEAGLVAGFMMHLFSERKLIYTIMLATMFLFSGLMYLIIWAMQSDNRVHLLN